MITVFYGNQVWDEYSDHAEARRDAIPEGAIAYSRLQQQWYYWYHSWCKINEEEVPAYCKAWMLIL